MMWQQRNEADWGFKLKKVAGARKYFRGTANRFALGLLIACSALLAGGAMAERGEAGEARAEGTRLTNERKELWEMGCVVRARGAMAGIVATLPVPMSWPEQDVEILDRSISRQVGNVRFRELQGGVRQLQITIPRLRAGDEAEVLVRMEIVKRDIAAPSETEQWTIPRRPDRELRRYLRPSPYIDSEDRKIVAAAEEAAANGTSGWARAEALYDWVREQIEYRFARRIKTARRALDDGYGDCEEMTSLFIAMCRAQGIPARAVWVPGHCYPEFYLEDAAGAGQWFPCQVAGTRSFGGIPESRPILQKGDNFRVPGTRKPQRYVKETLAARHAAAAPEVEFIRRKLE